MDKTEYIGELVCAFNKCKEIIKCNLRTVIISDEEKFISKETEYILPKFEEFQEIKIYSVSTSLYTSCEDIIHLSGVNILFYIASIYLRLTGDEGKTHIYTTNNKSYERYKIMCSSNFIFEYNENFFIFYAIKQLKATGKFIFDLPPVFKNVGK